MSDALDVITCAIERSPGLSARHIAEVVENDLVNARLLPDPDDSSAQRHADAWADTGDGYRPIGRRYVLQCLWCDKYFGGRTKAEALAKYREHEAELIADLKDGD